MSGGYCGCACRDCFEIAIADQDGEPTLCHECEEARCDVTGESECECAGCDDCEPTGAEETTAEFSDFDDRDARGGEL